MCKIGKGRHKKADNKIKVLITLPYERKEVTYGLLDQRTRLQVWPAP